MIKHSNKQIRRQRGNILLNYVEKRRVKICIPYFNWKIKLCQELNILKYPEIDIKKSLRITKVIKEEVKIVLELQYKSKIKDSSILIRIEKVEIDVIDYYGYKKLVQ